MPKYGVKFDYDLGANRESSKLDKCLICDSDWQVRWTDFHGEAVCITCGAPYQLRQPSGGDYKSFPALKIKENWIPICKDYWNKTRKFVFGGKSFSEFTGLQEFDDWIKQNHPEMIEKNAS